MKNTMLRICTIALCFALFSCQNISESQDIAMQYSTIKNLKENQYQGSFNISDASKYGDTGIGIYSFLDGKMIANNGEFYHINNKCLASKASNSQNLAFSNITFFKPEQTIKILNGKSYSSFKDTIKKEILRNKNSFYALKAEGNFNFIKLRSLTKKTPPYNKKISDIIREESVFYLQGIEGTLIGFWFPSETKGLTIPEFNFYFISSDKKFGGKVLDFAVENTTILADEKEFFMIKNNILN